MYGGTGNRVVCWVNQVAESIADALLLGAPLTPWLPEGIE